MTKKKAKKPAPDVLADIRALFLASDDHAEDHYDEIHDDHDVQSLPMPEYVIDGWIPRGLYSVLYGAPGVGKTFALLAMSRAVRRGTRWQDNKTRKGAVLFYPAPRRGLTTAHHHSLSTTAIKERSSW